MKLVRLEDVTGETVIKTELTPEELKEAYKLAKESFTAADLQKYTELYDDDVPMDEMLEEMEENQRKFNERLKDGE